MRLLPLLILLPTLAANQAVTLKRSPKVGDVLKYRITFVFTIYGNDVFYTAIETDKVVSVSKDGSYAVESMQEGISANNGQDLNVQKNSKPSEALYDARGQVLELKGDDSAESWRDANLSCFILPDKPVNKGDTWTANLPGKPERKTPGASVIYTSDGIDPTPVDGVSALKIEEKYAENSQGIHATKSGTIWVDPKDGTVVKVDEQWRNAPILGLSTLVNGHVSYERVTSNG